MASLCLAVVAAALVLPAPHFHASEPHNLTSFQKGMCWGHGKTAFYNHFDDYGSVASSASLAALAATGANAIQIETAWYMDNCSSTTLGPRNYTPADNAIAAAVGTARGLGLQVMLNAHIEVACVYGASCAMGCNGRTDIDFNTAGWDDWFASYTEFIERYGRLCALAGCSALTVHVELQTLGAGRADMGSRWEKVRRSALSDRQSSATTRAEA
eukprot:SAG31_NODE_2097_length_6453_cov_16.072867_6_plen_214_part_00